MRAAAFFPILLAGMAGMTSAAVLPRSDADDIAIYGRIGICFSYFADGNIQKELAPCSVWCPTQNPDSDPNAVGCKGPGISREKIDRSIVFKDDDGKEYTPGECICDLEGASVILAVVLKALSELDEVLCGVVLSAITTLVEVGLSALPGGAPGTAARRAVESAKTFAENGLDAASYFDSWIGAVCGIPNFAFNIDDVFQGLNNAPDSLGRSRGCFKKGGC
ncbi:hypothetical protein GGS23DRAFT_100165 [Durotheca rogersii]|uniref:uncharacterized protein n=1 Tax=Durotheca rogersii TaxID=419775 RepID=UPI0022209527|nr:uncharacterized protein GGS23DRAFT_100165 [Durotheca rogersii]KAI5862436.1 hypothetical protein GGS23DRAFT_100165 [Durotheca rogersii]